MPIFRRNFHRSLLFINQDADMHSVGPATTVMQYGRQDKERDSPLTPSSWRKYIGNQAITPM